MAAANEARQHVHQILRQWTLQKFQEKAMRTNAMRTKAMTKARTKAMRTKAMMKMADSVVAHDANAGNTVFYTFYLCNGLFE